MRYTNRLIVKHCASVNIDTQSQQGRVSETHHSSTKSNVMQNNIKLLLLFFCAYNYEINQ